MSPEQVENLSAIWIQRWSIYKKAEAAKAVKEKQLSDGEHTYTDSETELLWWLRE